MLNSLEITAACASYGQKGENWSGSTDLVEAWVSAGILWVLCRIINKHSYIFLFSVTTPS